MKILMSQLPDSDWWGRGTPVYLNNWSMTLGKIPNSDLTKKEHQQTIAAVKKFAELEIIPFPKNLDTEKLYKHDGIFVRDSFISNQQGKIVISNYSAKERQSETKHLKKYLRENNYQMYTLPEDAHAEGGEFYYVAKGNILFAGISRNNKKGVTETARYLGVDELCIIESNSYHLDCIFTIILDKKGKLAGIIASLKLINNKQTIKKFALTHHIPLFDILPVDSINFDGKGNIAVNCLPLPGVLIGGSLFETPGLETQLKNIGIQHIVTPVSQFGLSGGGTHCLTNELNG